MLIKKLKYEKYISFKIKKISLKKIVFLIMKILFEEYVFFLFKNIVFLLECSSKIPFDLVQEDNILIFFFIYSHTIFISCDIRNFSPNFCPVSDLVVKQPNI